MTEGNAEQKIPATVENRAAKPLEDSAEEHPSHGHRWNCRCNGRCNCFLWLWCSQDHNETHVAVKCCRRSQSVADCRISATAGRAGAQAGGRTSAISPEQAAIRVAAGTEPGASSTAPPAMQTKTTLRTTASGGLTYHFSHRTLRLVIAKKISLRCSRSRSEREHWNAASALGFPDRNALRNVRPVWRSGSCRILAERPGHPGS